MSDITTGAEVAPSLAPWLDVEDGVAALEFYKSAFDATETYRFDPPDGSVIARLAVGAAEFWIAGEAPENRRNRPQPLGGGSVRMILTVADPDTVFAQALAAGATEVYPVAEQHGWRLGRLVDPFGLHWEIGCPLTQRA